MNYSIKTLKRMFLLLGTYMIAVGLFAIYVAIHIQSYFAGIIASFLMIAATIIIITTLKRKNT